MTSIADVIGNLRQFELGSGLFCHVVLMCSGKIAAYINMARVTGYSRLWGMERITEDGISTRFLLRNMTGCAIGMSRPYDHFTRICLWFLHLVILMCAGQYH
jgi:hypothetical protein